MSVSRFIRYPIETNPTTLAELVYQYIQARAPQWSPNDGNLDVWIIQALTSIMAENRELATDVPADIFRWYGSSLIGLPPIDETPSTIQSTWTMIDSAGHTIPAGTTVGILDSAGNTIPFETISDTIVPTGSAATAAGGVTLRSINTGADTAGLAGPAVVLQLIDVLDFVNSITATVISSGGVDAETDDDYLDRLATHLRLLSTRPILPDDFASIAREIPGVYRAVAIDGYDPSNGTFNNLRTVSVAALDSLGAIVSPTVKSTILSVLEANREVNFVVHVVDPHINQVDVTYDATSLPGFSPASVQAAIDANLAAYMNALSWGTNPTGSPRDWLDRNTVRYSDVGAIISNTEGVDFWSLLTIGIHGGAPQDDIDLGLVGPAAIAVLNTSTGTVH